VLTTGSASAQAPGQAVPGKALQLEFADVETGVKILSTEDDFLARLSPFDLQSRMQAKQSVTRDQYLDFVAAEIRPWTEAQQQIVRDAFALVEPAIRTLVPQGLPPIQIIHSSGREEAGAAYTRGTAVVLPTARLQSDRGDLAKLLAHECFHVISRRYPVLRDGLYATIGFRLVGEITLPKNMRDLRITNPDAPVIQHIIELRTAGEQKVLAAPVLFADKYYDPEKSRRMFAYLQFQLMEVIRSDEDGSYLPVVRDNMVVFHSPNHPDFGRQIGRNTGYIIHPEEVLADNFADLVTGRKNAPDPWLTEKMRGVFALHAER